MIVVQLVGDRQGSVLRELIRGDAGEKVVRQLDQQAAAEAEAAEQLDLDAPGSLSSELRCIIVQAVVADTWRDRPR